MIYLILLCLLQAPTLEVDVVKKELRLSDMATMTITIVGDAPLRIRTPDRWLADTAKDDWIITVATRANVVKEGMRERWTITLNAEPFTTSDAVPLALEPISVQAGSEVVPTMHEVPPQVFRIVGQPPGTQVGRPGPILRLPDAAPRRTPWPVLFGIAGMFFGGCVLLYKMLRERNREQATATVPTLDDLTSEATPTAEFATALQSWLYEAHRLNPALTRTESSPLQDALQAILRQCEEAKFAGITWDETTRRDLLASARTTITTEETRQR